MKMGTCLDIPQLVNTGHKQPSCRLTIAFIFSAKNSSVT